ncbi:MAG: Zn-ribbon-containing protein [Roseburia sp.]|nr:Zn-ribbon-containing protein [Roseburia sp.]
MYIYIIELQPLDHRSETEAEDIITEFVAALIHNGQILSEYMTCKNDKTYYLYVTSPKSDSLDAHYDSIYVKRSRKLLNECFAVSIRPNGINANSREYCTCKVRSRIEMQTYVSDIDSVFTCCTCGKPIALYELPYLDNQQDHWSIINWQKTYRAMHELWLDSISDRFTGNQLVNVNSTLNKAGREIAKEIEFKTEIKVYYNVFDDLTKKVRFAKAGDKMTRICPACGKAMKYVKFDDGHDRNICESCGLSSFPKGERLS